MTEKYKLEFLLKALKLLAKGEIPAIQAGICLNLSQGYFVPPEIWTPVMKEACKDWSEYSGIIAYPIRHRGFDNPTDAYIRLRNKWGMNSLPARSYAKRRYELVDRMIKVVESKLSLLS